MRNFNYLCLERDVCGAPSVSLSLMVNTDLQQSLAALPPISLEEMSSIRLMKRTDTKYLTTKDKLLELLALARGTYYVQQIEGRRVAHYRTVYWDTDDYQFYVCHNSGARPRAKVRVRTYLDSDLTFLEVKRKDNHGETKKKRIPLSLGEEADGVRGREFLENRLEMDFSRLHPSLENTFSRITLVNMDKTERLTIDYDVHFRNCDTGMEDTSGNLVIVELKRDGRVPSPVKRMLWQLRVKPHGFSKYCIGSLLTNHSLRTGFFKEKLITINKLTNKQSYT